MSHGRGRGVRQTENNGSVGGEARSTAGSDADSKDDRLLLINSVYILYSLNNFL